MIPHGCPLSPKEYETLVLILEGKTYKQAAAARGVKFSTVRTQMSTACRKLGVANKMQAMALFAREGWMQSVPPAPDEDQRVTPTQRAYLSALSDGKRKLSRMLLYALRHEAGLPARPEREPNDDPLLLVLARMHGG